MLTDAQRVERRKGVTATDVAAILGLSPWRTPMQVQAEKLGLDERRPEAATTEAGHALEPVIAKQYERDNHGASLLPGDVVVAKEDSRLRCTPDYYVSLYSGPPSRLLECKSVFSPHSAASWGAPETDEVPYPYLLQVTWQLGVCGLDVADVARFYQGRVEYWRVGRDEALWRHLRATCLGWWEEHVERAKPVEPKADDLDFLRRHAPPVSAPVAQATPEEALALADWREAYQARKVAEAEEEAAEARVLAMLGVREGLEAEGLRVTYKATKGRSTIDWPAVARELSVQPEVLERHTKKSPAYRRPHCSWWREKSE